MAPEMTPEEWAANVDLGKALLASEEEVRVRSEIAEAVRVAVVLERVQCAQLANKMGRQFCHKQMHEAAEAIAWAILDRR